MFCVAPEVKIKSPFGFLFADAKFHFANVVRGHLRARYCLVGTSGGMPLRVGRLSCCWLIFEPSAGIRKVIFRENAEEGLQSHKINNFNAFLANPAKSAPTLCFPRLLTSYFICNKRNFDCCQYISQATPNPKTSLPLTLL